MKIPPKDQFRTATSVEKVKMGWVVKVELKGLNVGPQGDAIKSEVEAALFAFTTLGKLLHSDGFNVTRLLDVAINDEDDLIMGSEEES